MSGGWQTYAHSLHRIGGSVHNDPGQVNAGSSALRTKVAALAVVLSNSSPPAIAQAGPPTEARELPCPEPRPRERVQPSSVPALAVAEIMEREIKKWTYRT